MWINFPNHNLILSKKENLFGIYNKNKSKQWISEKDLHKYEKFVYNNKNIELQ